MKNTSDGEDIKIFDGKACRLYSEHTEVEPGDFIEYLDECCRRTRRVVDVHIGRKRKYVTVQELFRTNCRKVQLGNIVSVWRVCGAEAGVDDQKRAEENSDPLRASTSS